MGQDRELDQVGIIQTLLNGYVGLTSGEKKYCNENLKSWISQDKTLKLLIAKLSEISLDVRPLFRQNGLLV